jgi:hypothetical protein
MGGILIFYSKIPKTKEKSKKKNKNIQTNVFKN